MDNEQENDRQNISILKGRIDSRSGCFYSPGERYTDKWGEIWVRESFDYIHRISDGNIGGWFNGQGLTPVVY